MQVAADSDTESEPALTESAALNNPSKIASELEEKLFPNQRWARTHFFILDALLLFAIF